MKTPIPLLLLALAGACSSFEAASDYDPDFDFSGLRTYGWLEPAPDARPDDLAAGRITAAVDEALRAAGYEPRAADADFLVEYAVRLRDRVHVTERTTFHGRRYGTWGASQADVYEYQEGTLFLYVVDPTRDQLVWRGSATGVVRDDRTPEERTQKIHDAVRAILEDFPPR